MDPVEKVRQVVIDLLRDGLCHHQIAGLLMTEAFRGVVFEKGSFLAAMDIVLEASREMLKVGPKYEAMAWGHRTDQ